MPPRKTMRNYRKNSTARKTSKYSYSKPSSMSMTSYACSSPKYKNVQNECQWKIGSYRNVYSQFTPAGTKTIFSPTAANKWTKYVNTGNLVYKFTSVQFSKYFGTHFETKPTQSSVKSYLRKKYGVGIKDVIRGKGNCWLVATTKNITGRPFSNYTWK